MGSGCNVADERRRYHHLPGWGSPRPERYNQVQDVPDNDSGERIINDEKDGVYCKVCGVIVP